MYRKKRAGTYSLDEGSGEMWLDEAQCLVVDVEEWLLTH